MTFAFASSTSGANRSARSLSRFASAGFLAVTRKISIFTAETFTYDPWGNLLSLGPNSTTQPNYIGCTQESGFNYTGSISTKNQISSYCYDAAGNLLLETTCPTGSFTPAFQYDAENHLVSTAGVNYTYDGRGSGFVLANPELKTASAS